MSDEKIKIATHPNDEYIVKTKKGYYRLRNGEVSLSSNVSPYRYKSKRAALKMYHKINRLFPSAEAKVLYLPYNRPWGGHEVYPNETIIRVAEKN